MIALLSDVHANLTALEAVLKEIPRDAAIWVMGDTVGYGPAPSNVLSRLRERGARLVAGNHDLAVAGAIGVTGFNEWAAEAVLAHRAWLSAEERGFLAELPRQLVADDFTLVHGSLRDPVWEYVLDGAAAQASLSLATTSHCCNGHTHVPAVFTLHDGRLRLLEPRDGDVIQLAGTRSLVNPGSVGQPRDGDPRAAWAIYDPPSGTIRFRRTSYQVDVAQRAIRARKLPAFLAERLEYGI